jgi:tetratricopeptide (TPR) repeat protein
LVGAELQKFLAVCAAVAAVAAIFISTQDDNVVAYGAVAQDKAILARADAAPPQSVSELRRACGGYDADAAITACTHLIYSGRENAKYLFVEFYNRAGAYYRLGDFDRAIYDYSEAAGLDPTDPDSFTSIGRAFEAKSDDDQAIQNYTRAIALDPKNAMAFHHRGDAWYRKHENDRAVRDYNEAIRLNPKDEMAQNSLVSAQLKLLPYP